MNMNKPYIKAEEIIRAVTYSKQEKDWLDKSKTIALKIVDKVLVYINEHKECSEWERYYQEVRNSILKYKPKTEDLEREVYNENDTKE